MKLQDEMATARDLALRAAALVQTFRTGSLDVKLKGGDEPVTAADLAANELILAGLRGKFPRDAILSEEAPDDGGRLKARRVWMVDPIDGTRDFIDGRDGFAVMIGLCIDGVPALGAVAQPSTGVMFWGGHGLGAWREVAESKTSMTTTRIAAPPGLRSVSSWSHPSSASARLRAALGIEDDLRIGSVGVKMGLVADASRDLFVYPGQQAKLWDTCAPDAILAAAGGRTTDAHGAPLDYTAASPLLPRGIVATNGAAHALVLATLARLRSEN